MVEFSLVLPLLLLLTVGIVEGGLAFRDVLSVSSAVREGARVLSALGNDPAADCTALADAAETLGISGGLGNLVRVEIFKANADGSQNGVLTNRYTLSGDDPSDCDDWAKIIAWPSTGRNVVAGGSPPLDIAGMRIVYRHDWVIGLPPFSGSFTIDQSTISRLEPEEFA